MTELQNAEKELWEMTQKVNQLRNDTPLIEVKNYSFQTSFGKATLNEFFGDKDKLFVIHNMGQGCRYCTLWADGFNGFLSHFESQYSFVIVSKDDPETQRRFAHQRGWRFQMASHGGGDYMKDQISTPDGQSNSPGMACYIKQGDQILKKNSAVFGPGDEFCSFWNMISLAGDSPETFTPQFDYWKRPQKLDDGGANVQ